MPDSDLKYKIIEEVFGQFRKNLGNYGKIFENWEILEIFREDKPKFSDNVEFT